MVNSMRIFYFILVISTGLLFSGCYKEHIEVDNPETWLAPVEFSDTSQQVIGFNEVFAITDTTENLLLYSIASDTLLSFNPVVKFGNYQTISINGTGLVHGENNDLGQVVVNHPYQVVAKRGIDSDTFCLFFTSLPIVQIDTEKMIVDEPKVSSRFVLQYTDQDDIYPQTLLFRSYAGIEIRGASSKSRLKKSYGIELWDGRYGIDYPESLLGMRPSEDWILDALYIDKLKIRNRLSYEVWEKIATIPSADQMESLFPGVYSVYVELFLNNKYMGLYCLGEKINESLVNFSPYQAEKGGAIYKAIHWDEGSTKFYTFDSPPTETRIWDGWEQIYPKDAVVWDGLAQLRKTIVLEDDDTFEKEIGSLIDLNNVADYYLFLNMLRADDNTGKNIFFVRYSDQSPFFMIPWDVEASWGINWKGYQIDPNRILGNHLYERLLELDVEDFEDRIEEKWKNYRKSVFHKDTLISSINQHCNLLLNSGAIYRDNERWNTGIDINSECNYILEWIDARLNVLDEHFE